jgi:protein tyrosine phosphatase (PTP) superfamily phosphohydrolase (DUF442 family)
MKVHTILPGLYQRGAFHTLPQERKLAELAALNVRMVVCCCGDYDHDLDGSVTYAHIPFPDGKYVPTKLLAQPVAQAVDTIKAGAAVLAHCRAGRNRSALFSALVVREVLRVTGAEAVRHVRAGRPNAFGNEHFAAYLETLGAPV